MPEAASPPSSVPTAPPGTRPGPLRGRCGWLRFACAGACRAGRRCSWACWAWRLLRALVVRDPGRSRRANHLAVERAFQPGGDLRELSQPVVRPGLTRNLLTTLRRLALGFGLAALVGVPLGVLCGCFPRVQAFFLPMTLFGRNIPVAALIPLTFSLFGIGELQKVMFIFIACVAFVVWDTTRAVEEVGEPVHRHGLHAGSRHAGRRSARCCCRWRCPACSTRYG